MLNENEPKIYGLDNINKESNVYITEGPFDSTFIDNSIAMCGADVDVNEWNIENPVYVYDNEPRNKEIVNRISKVIDKGYKVVIWPNSIVEKDINDMVLSGLDVQNVVESNVYSSLQAKLNSIIGKRYEQWYQSKKRDGRIESLDLEKMHLMVDVACKGLSGVSASQVEINSGIQFYDGITTDEIQRF